MHELLVLYFNVHPAQLYSNSNDWYFYVAHLICCYLLKHKFRVFCYARSLKVEPFKAYVNCVTTMCCNTARLKESIHYVRRPCKN